MSIEIYIERMLERLQGLKPCYTYHSMEHTKMVLASVESLAKEEGVNSRSLDLLRLAALFHDCGFLVSAENHEERGCDLVRSELETSDFSEGEIDQICGMIMATKIPQSPKNKLEEILADADLFYLGTENYDKYSSHLFDELKHFNPKITEGDWISIQINFLESHQFHTPFCRENLEPKKRHHLERIRASLDR